MLRLVIANLGANSAFFNEEDETEGGVPVEVVPIEAFTSEESKPFIQGHRRGVGDFCFKGNLERVNKN